MRDIQLKRKTEPSESIPRKQLFNFATGLAGQNMTYSFVSGWLRYFCINILHIDQLKVGSLFFLSYFWDAINDPIIGAAVDRRRHKNGEKLRPYLLQLPAIIGVLSAMMFFKINFGENGKIVYIIFIYFLWDFFYSIQDVSLWGMVAASSPLSQERSRVTQWASIGAGAGFTVAGGFQMVRSILVNKVGMEDMQVFILFGLIFGLGGELISMRSHKLEEKVKSDKPKEKAHESITILRHNKTLLIISLARLLLSVTPKVQAAYFFENLVSYSVGGVTIDGQTSEVLYTMLSGIPGALAIFFATKIAKKIGGMKKILILSQLSAILLRVAAYFVGYQSIPKIIVVLMLTSLMNIPGSLMDIAHRSLTSDSIDYVEWKTGVRTEGISFSMQNFVTKMTTGISSFIEGVILKKLKYSSAAKAAKLSQNATFLKWQWPIFIVGPIVGALLYLVTILFLKDDRQQCDSIERELHKRHQVLEELKAQTESPETV